MLTVDGFILTVDGFLQDAGYRRKEAGDSLLRAGSTFLDCINEHPSFSVYGMVPHYQKFGNFMSCLNPFYGSRQPCCRFFRRHGRLAP